MAIGFLMHCGAQEVDLDTLEATPVPEATATHVPIPHVSLMRQTERALRAVDYNVVEQRHALAGDNGERYFGMLTLQGPEVSEAVSPYRVQCGLRNSHDKRFPVGWALGATVDVCDNLSFGGLITLARRHTVNLIRDLQNMIFGAVCDIPGMVNAQSAQFDRWLKCETDGYQVEAYLVEAMRQRILSPRTFPRALKAWDKPEHTDFEPRTAWSAFNSVTEALKGSNIFELPSRTAALHDLTDRIFEIPSAVSEEA